MQFNYDVEVRSLRSQLVLPFLNAHQLKIALMELQEARIHFDKICATPPKPKLFMVADGSVKDVRYRLYMNHAKVTGTLVYFHGGGFSMGSIDSHDQLARLLCKYTSEAVLSVNYHLVPEYPYPVAIEDGEIILSSLHKLSLKHHFEVGKITLIGDSAEASIALHLATRTMTAITALVFMYPAVQPNAVTESMKLFSENHFVTAAHRRTFWQDYLQGHKLPQLTKKQLRMLPPTLIITAEYNILRDEGKEFHDQLSDNGVKSEYHQYGGM